MTAVFQHYEALGRAIPEAIFGRVEDGVRAAFLSSLCPIEGVQSVLEDLRIRIASPRPATSIGCHASLSLTGLAPRFDTRLYSSQMVARGKLGAGPLPLRSRKDAGGSASHPRH